MGDTSTSSSVEETVIDHTYFLYIGPFYTPSPVIIPIMLTRSENYGLWSWSMRITLMGKKKLRFITGKCKRDSYTGDLLEQ